MVTIENLKKTIQKLNYKWYTDRPNLIAIRSKLQVPDVFNDILCTVWVQPSMPNVLTEKAKQQWLRDNLYNGSDNKPLVIDGDFGAKSQFALAEYNKTVGKERMLTATLTTEPGVYYQKHLLNPKGCWVMMPTQMVDAYAPGLHQGKSDHRCLRSVGKIYGMREDDKDGILFNDKDAKAEWVDGSTVGANIHGATKGEADAVKVGQHSAGCQVHSRWGKKEEMMDVCELIFPNIKRFTYTLIDEKDFVA